jgi:predicted phage tail protein
VADNAQAYNIVAVNMSLGDGGVYSSPRSIGSVSDALSILAEQGIAVVSAAGNGFFTGGSLSGVAYPAADPNSLGVGAVWADAKEGPFAWTSGAIDRTTGPDRLASFSQRSASQTEVFAPGTLITNAGLGGGLATYSGTSMAVPQVAATAAIAQQIATEYLGRRLTVLEFNSLVADTGHGLVDGDDEDDNVMNTGLAYRRLDIAALAAGILALPATPSEGLGGGTSTIGQFRPLFAAGNRIVSIAAGSVVTELDFGDFQMVDVVGQTAVDTDRDGQFDDSSEGLTIYIDANNNGELDPFEDRQLTDSSGGYRFRGRVPGAHLIQIVIPEHLEGVDPSEGYVAIVNRSGMTLDGFDFQLRRRNRVPLGVALSNSSVDENLPAGTIVGQLSAIDDDIVDTHAFTLLDNAAGKLSLDGNQIIVMGGVDFESDRTLRIRIRATDLGGLSTEQTVVINVNDRNEPPIIDSMNLSIPENSQDGLVLGFVMGRDPDADSVLNWSISDGNNSDAFTIDPMTGAISIARSDLLDFESVKQFVLTVIATDNEGLEASGYVTIDVTDLNEPPRQLDLSSLRIREGLPAGTQVGTLKTIDPDQGDRFSYQLVSGVGSMDNSSFTIVNNELRAVSVLDVSRKPSHSIRVRATDAAGLWLEKSFELSVFGRPGRPGNLAAQFGNGKVRLVWSPPASDGNATIGDYVIQYMSSQGSNWTTFQDGISPGTNNIVTGLKNYGLYRFRVAAVNEAGISGFVTTNQVTVPRPIPESPTDLAGIAGDGRVDLTWKAPSSNGGSMLRFYIIELSVDGGKTWRFVSNNLPRVTSASITGLVNGVVYVFRVSAVNLVGASWPSISSESLRPRGTPTAPNGMVATPGDQQVLLIWQAPASNGGEEIIEYVIQISVNNSGTWATMAKPISTQREFAAAGLENGMTYQFRVAAVNRLGIGAYSTATPSVRPRTIPTAPSITRVIAGDGQASLQWNAPDRNGGDAVADYWIEYTDSTGEVWTRFNDGIATTNSTTVTGLRNGVAYRFRVAAVNNAGSSPYSDPTDAVIPRGAPSMPTNVNGKPENRQAIITWNAPDSDGGTPIIDYVVQFRIEANSQWTTFSDGVSNATSATITGLTNGVGYEFRVAATNSLGQSRYSSNSPIVKPRTVPGPPATIVGTAGNGQVNLFWTMPTANGGAAILDYAIQYSTDRGTTWIPLLRPASTATSTVVTGLKNGVGHIFRVAAINAAGSGEYSAISAAITPVGPIRLTHSIS